MSVGARAMETKLQCLQNFQIKNLQHISNALRNLGPAPAAAPAAAPTSSGTLIAKALNAVRTAPASPLDETIPLQSQCRLCLQTDQESDLQTLIGWGHLQTDQESDLQTWMVPSHFSTMILCIITQKKYKLQLFHFCIDRGNSNPTNAALIALEQMRELMTNLTQSTQRRRLLSEPSVISTAVTSQTMYDWSQGPYSWPPLHQLLYEIKTV